MHSYRSYLRRIAAAIMMIAALAFVHQGALIAVSQAAAVAGAPGQPAVVLSGPVHAHDSVGGHVHAHAGDNMAGHVHGHSHADRAHQDGDDAGKALFCSLTATSAVIPTLDVPTLTLESADALQSGSQTRPDGLEPGGLRRPPRTPSIA